MFECLEEVHYGAMDMRADASGGGPVGLPYLFAMMTGAAVGIYAAILAGGECSYCSDIISDSQEKEKSYQEYEKWK